MKAKAKTKKVVNKIVEDKYTKEQIAKSKRFADNVDLVNAILQENKKYTLQEVDKLIENYMKGKVN